MQEKIDAILQEMVKLHLMFNMPRVTLNLDTGETKFEYVWKDDEMRQAYENLGELLLYLRKQQYAEQFVQRTRASALRDEYIRNQGGLVGGACR